METDAIHSPSAVDPEWLVSSFFWSLDSKVNQLDVTWDYLQATVLAGPGGSLPSLNEWEKLEPTLVEDRSKRNRERLKQHLRAAVREKVVRDWVTYNIKNISAEEARLVISAMETCLEQDCQKKLRNYLETVLIKGVTVAEKERKKQQRGDGYLGHIWAGITGCIKCGIAFGVLSAASSKFENIVLAMLVLIYISQDAADIASRYRSALEWIESRDQFKRLFRAIRSDELLYGHEAILEEQRENETQLVPRANVRFYISTTATTIIWLMVLWKLVMSLLS